MAAIEDVSVPPEPKKPIKLVINGSNKSSGELEVDVLKSPDEKLGDLKVEITDDTVHHKSSVEFVLPSQGEYIVIAKHKGEEISGSPLKLNLSKPDHKKVVLTKPPTGKIKAGQSIDILFDTYPAGRGELTAACKGEATGELPVLVTRQGITTIFKVTFLPPQEDEYALSVLFAGKNVKGSPYKIDMVPVNPNKVKCSKPVIPVDPTKAIEMDVSTEGAGNAQLKAKCVGEQSGEVPVKVNKLSKTNYHLSFQPPKRDKFSLSVLYGKKHILNSPFEINTKSKPELIKVGELHTPDKAGSDEDVWIEIDCSEAGEDKVKAECKGQNNNPDVKIEQLGSMKHRISFSPTLPDVYNLSILYGDAVVPGGTFDINLLPKSNSKLVKHLGTFVPDDQSEPVVLKFDASKAGEGEMRARVNGVLMAGPVDSEVTCVNKETKEYEVSFLPNGADTYSVDVYWSDESIPGSPISVKIVYPFEVLVTGPEDPLEPLQQVTVNVDTQYAGPGVLTASCSGKEAGDVDIDIIQNEADNTKYDISFRPVEADTYSLRLFFDNTEIKHSPVELEVSPKFQPELVKVGELHVPEKANSGGDVWVDIDCSKAGNGEVKAECKGENNNPDVKIQQLDSMKYRIKFTPTHPDVYKLSILYGDTSVPGGTFDVNLLPQFDSKMVQHLGTFIPDDPADPVILKFDASKAGDGEMRACANGVLMAGPVDVEVKCINEETKDYEVSFLPSKADTYSMDVYWSDEPIPSSPFSVKIVNPHEVLVSGPEGQLEPLQPVKVNVDTQYAGPGVLTASCSGKDAGDVDVKIIQNEADNTKYDVSFRPKKADSYSLKLFFDNTEIKNSPVEIEVSPKFQPELVTVGTLHVPERAGAGEDVWVEIDCSEAGKGEVKAECKGQLESPDVDIEQIDASKHRVTFTPAHPDLYTLTISYGDSSIPGGTIDINLLPKYDSKMVEHLGTSIPDDQSDPVVLKFDASKAGEGEMRARVNGVLMAGPVDCEVKCINEETQEYEVSFLPTKADTYDVDVYWSDESIPTSPISVKIVRPHEVLVSGPDDPLEPLQPVKVDVDTQYAGPGVLTASCSGKDVGDVDVEITCNEADNTKYVVSFRPKEGDSYSLRLFFDSIEIKHSPIAVDVIAKSKPELVKVGELHVPEKGGSGEDVWVEIDCSNAGKDDLNAECKGQSIIPVDIEEFESMKYRVKFSPTHPDVYTLTILYGDNPIPGGEFEINLTPKFDSTMVKHLGTFIPDDQSEPVVLKFDASRAGKGEMRVRVNGILMAGPVDSEVKCIDEAAQEYEVSFVPNGADTYNVDVYWSDETIPGSPIFVKIVYPHEVRVTSSDDKLAPLQPVKFFVDTQYAGPGVLSASCSGKEVGDMDTEIIRNEADNTKYEVSFRPLETDYYSLRLFFNDIEIKHSPVEVEIKPIDEPCVAVVLEASETTLTPIEEPDEVNTPTELDMVIGEPLTLSIDTEDAESTLTATASGKSVGEVPILVTKGGSDDSYTVVFKPTEPDVYTVDVKMDGSHVPSSPFIINYTQPEMVEPQITIAKPAMVEPQIAIAKPEMVEPQIAIAKPETVEPQIAMAKPEPQDEVPTHPITKPYLIRYIPEDGIDDITAYAIHDDSCTRCVLKIRTKPEGSTLLVFKAEKTGLHFIHILQGGKEIHGSPFKLQILPSDPRACLVLNAPEKSYVDELTTIKLDASKAGAGNMHVVATVPVGGKGTQFSHTEKGDGKFLIQFSPKIVGKYVLTIKWDNVPIQDMPIPVDVYELTEAMKQSRDAASRVGVYEGPKVFSGELDYTEGAQFFIKTAKAGQGNLTIKSKGPGDAKIDVAKQKDSLYACRMRPVVSGKYDLEVLWDGFPIPGSPFSINFTSNKTYIVNQLNLETKKFVVDKTYEYSIDCNKHKGALGIFATPSDCALVDVYRLKDNIYTVKITPQLTGNHEISLKFDGKHLFRSPYHVQFDGTEDKHEEDTESQDKLLRLSGIDFPLDLSDAPLNTSQTAASLASSRQDAKVTAFGPGLEDGIIGQEGNFTIKTDGCGDGKLIVAINGPRGSFNTCLRHHPDHERTVLARYDPTHTGKYTINIKWMDKHIQGSPFVVNIKPQDIET